MDQTKRLLLDFVCIGFVLFSFFDHLIAICVYDFIYLYVWVCWCVVVFSVVLTVAWQNNSLAFLQMKEKVRVSEYISESVSKSVNQSVNG